MRQTPGMVIITEAEKTAEILKSQFRRKPYRELLQKARDEAIKEKNLQAHSKTQSLEQIRIKSKSGCKKPLIILLKRS